MKNKYCKYSVIIGILIIIGAISIEMHEIMLKYGCGDFPSHIAGARDLTVKNYSLLTYIYRFLLTLIDNNQIIVMFLSACVVLGVVITAYLIKEVVPDIDDAQAYIMAFCGYIMNPIFIPALNPYRVFGVQASGQWHSPTLLVVKLFLSLSLYYYVKIHKRREIKDYIALAVTLALATGVKSNLTICFGAIWGIEALWYLFSKNENQHRKRFLSYLLVGVPSILILLLQYSIMYGTGASDDGGIAIMPFYCLRLRTVHPFMSIVQTLAFPLFVLVISWKRIQKSFIGRFIWGMTVIAYIQHLFLVETGIRMQDGNWTWGTSICNFGLLVISMCFYYEYLKDTIKNKNTKSIVLCVVGGTLLLAHLIAGIVYIYNVFVSKNMFI